MVVSKITKKENQSLRCSPCEWEWADWREWKTRVREKSEKSWLSNGRNHARSVRIFHDPWSWSSELIIIVVKLVCVSQNEMASNTALIRPFRHLVAWLLISGVSFQFPKPFMLPADMRFKFNYYYSLNMIILRKSRKPFDIQREINGQ